MSSEEIRAVTASLEKLMKDLRANVQQLEDILTAPPEEIRADTEVSDDQSATA